MGTQNNVELVATTLQGLENVLAEEIKLLGGNDVKPGNRAVTFKGDLDLIYKCNLRLRTALRILKPFYFFDAKSEDELYKAAYRVDWLKYIAPGQTFAIEAAVHSPYFRHSQYAMFKVKDAIVDKFRESSGERPNIDIKKPDVRLHLHLTGQGASISLDSSGKKLNKRGYRHREALAPLNEVLAAGMILLSGWRGQKPFLDPMCGSGTLAIEAAMIAANISPGLLHKEFGFMNWPDYDEKLFEIIRENALSKITDPQFEIFARDKSPQAVSQTMEGIQKAGVQDFIKVESGDFFNSNPPAPQGTLIANPPYDVRMREVDIFDFYDRMASYLKNNYSGWNAWVISGNTEALKRFGLKPSRKYTLYNGPQECRFQGFELYSGSRKKNQ